MNVDYNDSFRVGRKSKMTDIDIISLSLTAEFMSIDSENSLFKQAKPMKRLLILQLLLFSLLASAQSSVKCLIKTSLGDITVALYPEQAPITTANFLNYINNHLYDGSSFFRVCTRVNEADREIKIEVIQGGNIPEEKQSKPISLETTAQTKLLHKNGILSMARDSMPDSATSEFFICINDQPQLDFGGKRNPDGQGFAAFGKVIKGMKVVKKIQKQKVNDQHLITPVTIYSIRRME